MAQHLYVTASVRSQGSKFYELGQHFCDGLDFGGAAYREQSMATAKSRLTQIAATW